MSHRGNFNKTHLSKLNATFLSLSLHIYTSGLWVRPSMLTRKPTVVLAAERVFLANAGLPLTPSAWPVLIFFKIVSGTMEPSRSLPDSELTRP